MNLPHDLQQFVGQQMLQGNFETVDDLIAEAVALLRDKYKAEFYEMVDLGRKQIENGECICLETEEDVKEFFDKIKRREPICTEPTA